MNNNIVLQKKDDFDPEELGESGIDHDFVRITYDIVLSLVIVMCCYIIIFIIHQIFSLARDWFKRVTWANKPQFLKPMDNKHNSLNLAAKICSDIFPWTLSVPRRSQFSLSFALGKLFAFGTENVCGQISEHIFEPNEGYCLHITIYF